MEYIKKGVIQCLNCGDTYTSLLDYRNNVVGIELSNGEQTSILKCEFCKQPLNPSTIREAKEVVRDSSVKLQKVIMSLTKSLQENPTDTTKLMSLGLFFLLKRGYLEARKQFEKIIDIDPMNPDAYFYLSIALLEGKKPFIQVRSTIDRILENINLAYELYIENDINPALCLYFHAFIKYDFFSKKYLRISPDYKSLLMDAYDNGLTIEESNDLFEILNVPKPDEF